MKSRRPEADDETGRSSCPLRLLTSAAASHAGHFKRVAGQFQRHRFALAFLFIGLVVSGLGVIILMDLQRAQRQSREMYERSVHDLDFIGDLQYQTQEARRSMIYALTTPDANRQVEAADASRAADAQVARRLVEHRRLAQSPADLDSITRFERGWTNYLAIRDELIGAILEGSAKDALARDQREGIVAFNQVRDDLQAIGQIFKENARRKVSEMETLFGGTLIKLSAVLAVTLLFAVFASQTVQKIKMLHAVQASAETLRSSEQRKSAIVESALDCIIAIDEQGLITEFNPSAEKTFGHTRASVLGKPMVEVIVPPSLREQHNRGMARYLATGKTRVLGKRIEITALRSNGEEFPIELAITQMGSPDGRTFTAFLRDITEREQAEVELKEVHQRLLETSRQAGMAEVATGVLHNVGNVLNSVNVSATLLADRMRKSRAGKVGQVAALLRDHAANPGAFLADDPRGQQLPAYLSQLADHLTNEKNVATAELESLQKNIEHIKEIVAMQQSYAKVSGVSEVIEVTELVEDALRLNAGALERHGVSVIRQYDPAPPISVERHKVLQILVNLVGNARYACVESGRPDKQVTVRVAQGDGHVRIAVSDNGVGIPPENLTRIFHHGFTTKRDGHGFGLHSGALAAKELDGTLSVASEGVGKGATFTLELPLEQEAGLKLDAA